MRPVISAAAAASSRSRSAAPGPGRVSRRRPGTGVNGTAACILG